MKQHWHINPLPPPKGSDGDHPNGTSMYLLLAFVVIGPLIYFGPELRAVETWIVSTYSTVEGWLLPIWDWLLGLAG